MAVACSSCGLANAGGQKFCGECGAKLTAVAGSGNRERKVVSVLFCDLVGFTAASDGADPEDVQAALSPYHLRARAEIERFGGTVEKFIGDAVMAVFGAPVVHEDDPERAVRAGLRLLEAIEELNDTHGLSLSVRIGVATGEAVVSTGALPERGEGMVAGDVVNTAARLQTSAPTGMVVVGEATWRATRASITYKPLDSVQVKGKNEPLAVWAAAGARSRAGEALTTTSTTLVGRQDELEVLQRTYARCLRESSVQLVTIVAEPGVGKSRLVQEFRSWVDRREELVTWRQGRCLPYGEKITFWALGQIVKAEAGILDTDPPDVLMTKLGESVSILLNAAGSDLTQLAWLTARLAPLIGSALGESSREESFTAWQRFIEAMAATGPVVLVIEDLHWADLPLLDFCNHLIEWISGVPVLLVTTARPELFDTAPTWGGGHRNATTIGLAPLTDTETSQLIAALLGAAVLPAATHARLLQRAEGNPLFAEEFVRMLADQGLLPSGAAGEADAEALSTFPDSVQAIIAARLDTLSTDAKHLLANAAVVGQNFWSGAVSALTDRGQESVSAGLHDLSRRGYLRMLRSSSIADQTEYAFSHALITEVAYQQIPRGTRGRQHAVAGEWLVKQLGEDPGDEAAVIAHHYQRAHSLSSMASGAAEYPAREVADLADRARHWLVLAGRHAAIVDLPAAEHQYLAALDITPADHRQHPAILVAMARVQRSAGRFDEAIATLVQAEAELEILGLPREAAAAALIRVRCLLSAGRGHEGSRVGDAVITTLEEFEPGPELFQAYEARATYHAVFGRHHLAIEWANTALDLASRLDSPPDTENVVSAMRARGVGRCWLGDADGEADMLEALRLAKQHNLTDAQIAIYTSLGYHRVVAESVDLAVLLFDAALELARARGRGDDALAAANKTETLAVMGRWSEALDLCATTLGDDPDRDRSRGAIAMRTIQIRVHYWLGDVARAQELLKTTLPAALATGDLGSSMHAALTSLACAQAAGNRAESDRRLAALVELLDPSVDIDNSQFLSDLARVLLPAGRSDIVTRMAAASTAGLALYDNGILTAKAVLAEHAGDTGNALRAYLDNAAGWERYGAVFEAAQAWLGAGRCRIALGEPAAAELEQARSRFEALGARPLLNETLSLLQTV